MADEYLAQVMVEIDEEVRLRRAELPPRIERELDELFLEHSPVAGRGGDMAEALRLVDASVFIDPVVPVASQKSGGTAVKKGLRSLNLWYIGYVTHQVSTFAASVSRALHLLDERVEALTRQLPELPEAPVLDTSDASSWWVELAAKALDGAPGRVLHAACGDGWLVRHLVARGVDAYGVDPRPGRSASAETDGTDLREEGAAEHLRAVAPAALAGVVLSGVVEGMTADQRTELLRLLDDRLAPEAVLVLHSLSPSAWAAEAAPPEVDLAPGRPLRPGTWVHLLAGWRTEVHTGAGGVEYLVVARR